MHCKDQQVVRGAMEKALGPAAATATLSHESPMLKPFMDWLPSDGDDTGHNKRLKP
ncbi:hypothetical protein ABZP36_005152 [Zizania latifolia]